MDFSIHHIFLFIFTVGVGAVGFAASWVCDSLFVLPLWARMGARSPGGGLHISLALPCPLLLLPTRLASL